MSAPMRVRIQWSHPETDEMFTVKCAVSPGTPDRGPDMNCAGGYPGDPAEVDILSVHDDQHQDRPEIVDLLEREHMPEIEEAALQEAANREEDAIEREAEMAADTAREGW